MALGPNKPTKSRRAKKATPTTAAGPKPARKSAARRRRPASKTISDKTPLGDEEEAFIWTLADEGCSQREIARQSGRHLRTVQRVLAKDPAKLQAIRAAAAEERAVFWREHERESLQELLHYRALIHDVICTKAGKRRKLTDDDRKDLSIYIRVLNPVRHIAEAATVKHELLIGQPTERIDEQAVPWQMDPDQWTDERIITETIRGDLVDRMPARMKKVALQWADEGKLELSDAHREQCQPSAWARAPHKSHVNPDIAAGRVVRGLAR